MSDSDSAPQVRDSILECIGNTPLVRLGPVREDVRTQIWAKCEFLNPGSSVKDRIGSAMIEDAMERGVLSPGDTVVEGTAGNTGLALAMTAAIKGLRCVFTMPDKMSREKMRLLEAFGAEVIVTPTVGPDHEGYYVNVAKKYVQDTPGAFLANQFYNQVNPTTHYRQTGPELWRQTAGHFHAVVGGCGTAGTLSGVGRFVKEQNPDIRVVAADPEGSNYKATKEGVESEGGSYKVEGIGGDVVPETAWMDFIDEFRAVSDRTCFHMARRLTREEGLFVGGSSGGAAAVALDVARELDDPEKVVVVFLTDTGERYLSKLFDDDWMRENGYL